MVLGRLEATAVAEKRADNGRVLTSAWSGRLGHNFWPCTWKHVFRAHRRRATGSERGELSFGMQAKGGWRLS